MAVPIALQSLFDSLAQAARSDRLLIFIGSGLSAPYGLPTWRALAETLRNQDFNQRDLPREFTKYEQIHGKVELHDFLERKLGLRPTIIREVTRLIFQIRSVAMVTTNADRILETAAERLGAPLKVSVSDADLEDFNSTPWLRLIKLHGTLDQKDSLVFTTEEYAEQPESVPALRAKVADLMRFCNVVFLGYSLADADFLDLIKLADSARPGNIPQMIGLFSKAEVESDWRKIMLDYNVRKIAPLREVAFEDFGPTPEEATVLFLKELKDRITPDQLPTLTNPTVVFTHGYTATLKTELANYLSNCLGIHLFATHRYGSCTTGGKLDEAKRQSRYQHMLEDACRAIDSGSSVILDGTFAEPKWREVVYSHAQAARAKVIVVKTRCEDENYIRIRLWRRRLDHSRSDHEVTDISNFYETREAVVSNPVEEDLGFVGSNAEVITFENHSDRTVKVSDSCSRDTRILADLIRLSPFMSTHI